jgi:hypothetical protein
VGFLRLPITQYIPLAEESGLCCEGRCGQRDLLTGCSRNVLQSSAKPCVIRVAISVTTKCCEDTLRSLWHQVDLLRTGVYECGARAGHRAQAAR